jgi:hypothetical protein
VTQAVVRPPPFLFSVMQLGTVLHLQLYRPDMSKQPNLLRMQLLSAE